MNLLSISKVLTKPSRLILEELYGMANDHDLDTLHTNLSYQSDGEYVIVSITARALTDQMQPGRYTGQTQVRYRRESLSVLFNGSPEFFLPKEFPVNFGDVKAHLSGNYGVVIENADILLPGSNIETISDNYNFIKEDLVATEGVVEFRIAPNSPRFIPAEEGGGSLVVRILDPYESDLRLLGPTKSLPPVTSLDA